MLLIWRGIFSCWRPFQPAIRDERTKTRHRRCLDWPERGEMGHATDPHDGAMSTQMRISSVCLKRNHLVLLAS